MLITNPQHDRACQLERKLQLFLGSQKDWLAIYREWLGKNGIPTKQEDWPSSQACDDYTVNLFVRRQREGAKK